MSPKELLYIEDALGLKQNTNNQCRKAARHLTDTWARCGAPRNAAENQKPS